jgi:hypothetical protein
MKNFQKCIALGFALFALSATVSTAQTVTKQQAITDINTLLPSNTVSLITAEKIRQAFSKALDYAETRSGAQGPTGQQGPAGTQGAVGPQGPQGTQGIQGIQGTQGVQGVQGPAGQSAFQVWLTQPGNSGKSEAEFLISIQGPQGNTGAVGPQGVAGPQGPSGGGANSTGASSRYYTKAEFEGYTTLAGSVLGAIQNGTGAIVTSSPSGVYTDEVGVCVLNTGSTTAGYASVYSSQSGIYTNADTIKVTWWAYINQLPTATDNFTALIGFGDGTAAVDQQDGADFRITHDGSAVVLRTTTSSSNNRTATDVAGFTVAANTRYKFEVHVTIGYAKYLVNGVQVATSTTNVPNASRSYGLLAAMFKSSGTTPAILTLGAMECVRNYTFTK